MRVKEGAIAAFNKIVQLEQHAIADHYAAEIEVLEARFQGTSRNRRITDPIPDAEKVRNLIRGQRALVDLVDAGFLVVEQDNFQREIKKLADKYGLPNKYVDALWCISYEPSIERVRGIHSKCLQAVGLAIHKGIRAKSYLEIMNDINQDLQE